MPEPSVAFVALGANLGDPARQVEDAIAELALLPGTRLTGSSSLYHSRAVGYTGQPDFVNAVARLDTVLSPRALLDRLLDIERRHGRERTFRDAPRTLDLDILLHGDLMVDEPGLRIPHPRMHERVFVLAPLVEIAPAVVIPGRGPALALLAALDRASVSRLPAGRTAHG